MLLVNESSSRRLGSSAQAWWDWTCPEKLSRIVYQWRISLGFLHSGFRGSRTCASGTKIPKLTNSSSHPLSRPQNLARRISRFTYGHSLSWPHCASSQPVAQTALRCAELSSQKLAAPNSYRDSSYLHPLSGGLRSRMDLEDLGGMRGRLIFR